MPHECHRRPQAIGAQTIDLNRAFEGRSIGQFHASEGKLRPVRRKPTDVRENPRTSHQMPSFAEDLPVDCTHIYAMPRPDFGQSAPHQRFSWVQTHGAFEQSQRLGTLAET